jgi:hypothetical protein
MVASCITTAGALLCFITVAGLASPKSPLSDESAAPAGTLGEEAGERAPTTGNTGVPLRILPLGDSITHSDRKNLSYRYALWMKLVDAGIDFDFVGSLDSNCGGSRTWPAYKGRSFDPEHEGHWGWRVDQILDGVSDEGSGNLSEWLRAYTPDVVLMHLGTNDALQLQSASSTVNELRRIIEVLRADNPSVIIFVARLIPTNGANANSLINQLNVRIDRIATEASTEASPVIVVDQNSGFDVRADTYDSIHPNKSGEEKMAARWFSALKGILDDRFVNHT